MVPRGNGLTDKKKGATPMTTRRIFLQPTDILEILNSDGQSCLKVEARFHKTTNQPIVVLWPQPRIPVGLGDVDELLPDFEVDR